MLLLLPLVLFLLLPLAAAIPGAVVYPAAGDFWVIGSDNTLVFNWTGKAGVPVTTLYNVDPAFMAVPFFWESQFYVVQGQNVVRSKTALVGAHPGPGYYLGIDVVGKHITSETFEIKAEGATRDASPYAQMAQNVRARSGARPRAHTPMPLPMLLALALPLSLALPLCAALVRL